MNDRRSPFKFLDAYQQEDKDIFFGRETEVETLYRMTYHTNLILLYGMSGTGKTSIINCGLANSFDSSDWFEIYIRRQENINDALVRELKAKDISGSFEPDYSIPQMVESLYKDFLRPVYLIFDQFEELFILGSEAEQEELARHFNEVLLADLPCKIIISMREEYLARLSVFEKIVPRIFDKRLRIEPMTRANARRVILQTAQNPRFNITLCYDSIADDIIDNVTQGAGRVQLAYLQVFLDKMYRLAAEEDPENIYFDEDLVKRVGGIEDVLGDFLEEQLDVFGREIDRRDMGIRWLKLFVSDKGTKVPIKYEEIREMMPEMSETRINIYLEFFVNRRILRPLENEQYELAHDSLANKIFDKRPKGVSMPRELPEYPLPDNPYVGFEPYTKEMAALFFGRQKEIQELFDKVVNELSSRTTLVIGPMGVGKTSLIRAGLWPRLEPLMKVQYLRVSREFIDSTMVQNMLTYEPQPGEVPILLRIAFQWEEGLPDRTERKVIILDQFEEFYIWVQEPTRLLHLSLHLAYLLDARQNTDLILVVRDEFFSQLQELEVFVPNILEEQVRIRHVDYNTAADIIRKSAEEADLLIDSEEVINKIIQNVKGEDGKVNLTYLQLYMDRLYKAANGG
jgi:GTPase SAR1 family protein